ncbi:MAG: polysaccharide deacetylase family protein [Rubrivivax sp.]
MIKLIKSAAKAVLSPVLDATGLYDRRIKHACREPETWAIVMYHRVIDDPASDPFQLGMCVSRERFERQIRYLCQRFNIISMADGFKRHAMGQPLPRRALSVTFDDGYLDNLTCALPILQRHGVPFSVYVPTGGMLEGEPLWWDRAITALAGTHRLELDLQELGLSESSDVRSLRGVFAPETAEAILDRLWSLPPAACADSLERLERALAPLRSSAAKAPRLSIDQLRELHRQGVEIGAHSVSHPNLTLLDAARCRHEVVHGRQQLEDWLQTDVVGFAYPGGRINEVSHAAVVEAGFGYGLSTDTGLNRAPLQRHQLLRIGMPDAHLADFRRSVGSALTLGHSQQHVRS